MYYSVGSHRVQPHVNLAIPRLYLMIKLMRYTYLPEVGGDGSKSDLSATATNNSTISL